MIRKRFLAGSLLVLALPVPVATAHFKLNSPASMSNQNAAGDPQKSDPCGQDDPNFVLTNQVTPVLTGSTIAISIDETIGHEGHFRVALAADMMSLPADPPVTAGGGDPCDATVIDTNPTFPILADGLLPHVAKLQGAQTMNVALPAGMQCTNCVLQVIQYMRNHSAPCFYHHCAAINISDNPPPLVDGAPGSDDAGVDPGGGGEVGGGCCSSTRDAPSAFVLGLLVVGLLARRRRR